MANGDGTQYLPGGGAPPVPLTRWTGIYAASVAQNNDPLGQGRVRLQVPQVMGIAISAWALPMTPYSGPPAVGSAVAATFLGGDPTRPAWFGSLDLSDSGQTLTDPNIIGGTISGATFKGTNWIEDSSGMFLYSGTPAARNLIASLAATSGTDAYGNVYEAGITSYVTVFSDVYEVGLNQLSGGQPGLAISDVTHPPYGPAGVFGLAGSGTPQIATASLTSGMISSADVAATVDVLSQADSGITNGKVTVEAGMTEIGVNASLIVNDNTGSVNAVNGTAASPTLITTDTWHPITLDSGNWTGGVPAGYHAMSYRLLPDGNVQLAGIADHGSATTGAVTICNSNPLPAEYRPASTKYVRVGDPVNRFNIQITSAGVLTAEPTNTSTAVSRYAEIDSIYSLL